VNDTATSHRKPAHDIAPLFHHRWSPRSFTEEEIPEATLLRLFEAARCAPSAMNAQPWRSVHARRRTPAFGRMLATLAPANQAWAGRAAALIAVISRTTTDDAQGKGPAPLPTHSFDAGAAWAQLALQAQLDGWSTHAMGGFDRSAAREALQVPRDHEVEVFVAVGRRGEADVLPEWARSRERPNDRKSVEEIASEGVFRF
jgi:nitroreductase